MIRRLIKYSLKSLGYKLVKGGYEAEPTKENTMFGGLLRIHEKGIQPATILDIGAASGTWTAQALKLWNGSDYLLFEPLEERKVELTSLCNKYSNITFIPGAAGEKKSKTFFSISSDLDGSGFYGAGNLREVQVFSIDEIVNEEKKQGTFIIKLDTHGYEIPILKGAREVLKETELLIIEVYGFQVAPGALLFWEICQYLDGVGFRLFDVVDVMRRSKDNAFWQADAFFIKKDESLFNDNSFA